MSVSIFFDTNIFAYAVDPESGLKGSVARELIAGALKRRDATISYQVVHEFVSVVSTKFPKPLSAEDIKAYMTTVFSRIHIVSPSMDLCGSAIDLRVRHKLSWYDALIVAAAAESGCTTLYTEDLQHGAAIAGVRIKNPFRKPS